MQTGLLKKAETVKSLAARNGVTTQYVNDLIHQGMQVESEHSTNSYIQRTIAIQHLSENLQYYKGLKKMEKSFDRQGKLQNVFIPQKESFEKGGDLNSKLAGTPAGGAIEKIENGKKEITSDGTEGGIFKGQRHSESNGGIDGIVDGSGQVKVENEEALIVPESVNKQGMVTFNGRQMTNKQVLSEINTSAGGVPIKQAGGPVYKGGGPVADDGTGNAIRLKGSSVVITRNAVLSDKKTEFNGKMLTNRQILSQINQSGGGAAFEEGGNLPPQISCSTAQYSYGGKMMHAEEIATDMNNTCGCKHSMKAGGTMEFDAPIPEIFKYNDADGQYQDKFYWRGDIWHAGNYKSYTNKYIPNSGYNKLGLVALLCLNDLGSIEEDFGSIEEQLANPDLKDEQVNSWNELARQLIESDYREDVPGNYIKHGLKEVNGSFYETTQDNSKSYDKIKNELLAKQMADKVLAVIDFDKAMDASRINGWSMMDSSKRNKLSIYEGFTGNKSMEAGGNIDNQNSKEAILTEIAQIELPDLFKIAFKGQPWRIMKYIQEQATGMSGENNGVGENSYDNIVRMVGSEDLVKKCITLLSNPKKRKILHFIENSNHPAPAGLIEALEIKKNFETGGTVAGSGAKIVSDLKKDFIFIASLKAALDNGTSTSGWDINLFKSSFYNALAKLHKNDKTENLKEIFDFIKQTEKNVKLSGPVFTDAHKIWKLKPADLPPGEPEQESKEYPVDKPMRSSDIPALVKQFMPEAQQKAIVGNTELWDVIDNIYGILQKMPHTYQTQNIDADEKIVSLHYFYGGSDWYIVEKDKGNGPSDQLQTQAFGYTIMNGDHEMAEWGYINIEALKTLSPGGNRYTGIELDFYFTPVKFGQLKKKWEIDEEPEKESVPQRQERESDIFSYGSSKVWGVPENYPSELLKLLVKRGFELESKNSQSVVFYKDGHNLYINDNGGEFNLLDKDSGEHICDIAYVGSHPTEWVATPEQLAAKIEMYFDEYYNINDIKGTEEKKPVFVPRPGTFSYGVDFGVPENDSQLLLTKLREQGFGIMKSNGSSVVIMKDSMPKILVNDNGGEFNIKEVAGNAHITNEPYDTTTGIIPPEELAVNISNIYDEHFNKTNESPNPFKDRYFGDVIINPLREINDQFELFNELSSITIGYKGYTLNVQDNRRLKSNPDNSYSVFYATKENDYDQIAKIDEGDYGSVTELARLIEAYILTFVDKKEREKSAPVSQPTGKIVLSNTMKTIDLDENGKSIMENDDDHDDFNNDEPSHITDHNPTPQEIAADPDSFSAAEKTGTENLIQMYQGKKQSVINDAIRALLKKKGPERNLYSADEIAFLKLYEGAGGLAKQGETGARLFDQFFTPVDICGKMWGFALKYGFKFEGANILEPSVGSGRILQFIPPNSGADVVAYDVDETCYLLCKVLFPDFDIRYGSFEEMFFKGRRHIGLAGVTDFFDLVITNPPYREYISEWNKLGEGKATGATTFEMYFIARGVDVLKPGGLLIMLIPNTFLSNDKKYNDFKEKLAQKVDFLDAYRFPNGVFGNTDVGTDLIVLRKK